ncbi:MAG TPA: carboxypeptidase-like regulatory domain-containing protein, partial [Gemmatimonadaceae bacterium]|nr:carboxypeptidase-like regulatory domain-containing protein [Gemmatimonadaceae bacterium]
MDRQSYFPKSARLRAVGKTRTGRLTVAFLSLFTLLLAPIGFVYAQAGTVSGVVLDRSQTPLQNAQVSVRGTQLGTQTDANGRFRI